MISINNQKNWEVARLCKVSFEVDMEKISSQSKLTTQM